MGVGVDDLKKTGVYVIKNLFNGKLYIGSSARSFRERFTCHRQTLRRNRHYNRYLQAAWNLHGEAAFSFEILLFCEPKECIDREQEQIVKHDSNNIERGYNLRRFAGNSLGMIPSKEARDRMSRSHTGLRHTSETLAKISATSKFRNPTPEFTKRRLALAREGWTPEARANARLSQIGKKRSPETIAKMTASQKARGATLTPEQRAEMSRKAKARVPTPEQRAKLSASLRGVPKTPEHRANLSASHKRRVKLDAWFKNNLGMLPTEIDWEVPAA